MKFFLRAYYYIDSCSQEENRKLNYPPWCLLSSFSIYEVVQPSCLKIFAIKNPFEVVIKSDLSRWIEKSKFILNDSTYSGLLKKFLIVYQLLFRYQEFCKIITMNSQTFFFTNKIKKL